MLNHNHTERKRTMHKTIPAEYEYQEYDVAQIKRDGKWLDYATIRDARDARYAKQLVNGTHPEFGHGRTFFHLSAAEFRIRRRDETVFERAP